MMRDFKIHLQSTTNYLEPMGFKETLRRSIATHSLGNKINQISSN